MQRWDPGRHPRSLDSRHQAPLARCEPPEALVLSSRLARASVAALLLASTTALSLSACFRNRGDDEDVPAAALEKVYLVVENRYKLDVVVYSDPGGLAVRLGEVTAYRTETFTLSSVQVGAGQAVRFFVRSIGDGGTWGTSALSLHDGDTVTLTLESNLQRSSWSVQ